MTDTFIRKGKAQIGARFAALRADLRLWLTRRLVLRGGAATLSLAGVADRQRTAAQEGTPLLWALAASGTIRPKSVVAVLDLRSYGEGEGPGVSR